jgi:serine/threonine protein kinase
MGAVYKARDPQLDRVVAVKLPRIDTPPEDRPKRVQRFLREARAAAQVWHPHVCPIYDVGECDGQPYVVMAYVEGQSLADRLKQQGRYEDVAQAVALVRQVLDALEAVHDRGIIHRDLKPGNILIDAAGRAVLTDFGLARPEADAEPLTSEEVVVGTPAYMAPEQAAGRSDRLGPWTDLYGLGVVFFQMLTGRLPFEGPAPEVLARILSEPPPPLASVRPYLDPALGNILLKAMTKDPGERYQNARAFADALERFGTSQPTTPIAQQPNCIQGTVLSARSDLPPVGTTDRRPRLAELNPYFLPGIFFVAAFLCYLPSLAGRPNASEFVSVALLFTIVGVAVPFFRWLSWISTDEETTVTNRRGETALMLAAERGQAAGVTTCLARGAGVNEKDKRGQTALMKAAANGHVAIVRLLLARGAEVMERDQDGQTALAKAAAKGHAEIVALLKQAGAEE